MAGRCTVYSSNCAAGAGALPSSSDAFFLSGSSSAFLGSRSMLSFNDVNGSKRPYFQSFDADEFGDEELDEYFHQPEKKRRLTVDQVRFLEKSFEVENKLEPERKVQLAKDLGLQPRQVAIWFQNRRARWKTKQLEKDFEVLQASYNSLSEDYEKLLKEKDRLKSEVSVLSEKVLLKEKEGDDSKLSGNQNPTNNLVSEGDVSGVLPVIPKQEEACSAKSDILDSDSPHYADGHCPSSLVEPGDSSYGFDHDQSDLSQDEDDNLGNNLGPAYIFPKLGDSNYMNLPASSCNAGFSASDHPFWSWSY